jgi:hypothetical protein
LAIDHFSHGLGLGQIKPAIDKSPLGKFTRPGRISSQINNPFQNRLKDKRPTMTINFHHVFAGIGMRSWHITDEDLIHGVPFSAENMAMVQSIGFEIPECRTGGAKQLSPQLAAQGAADTDNANSSGSEGSGDGDNGGCHMLITRGLQGIIRYMPEQKKAEPGALPCIETL